MKGSESAKGEQEYHDAIGRLRRLACTAVTPEDFAAAAREAEHLLDVAAASAFARPEDGEAAERVEALTRIHRSLVRAVGLAVLRRRLERRA